MKDQIIEVLEGSEPVDALQALIAAAYAVADANGVSRFTLTELFSTTIDAYFDVANMVEKESEESDESDESDEDEQTDN